VGGRVGLQSDISTALAVDGGAMEAVSECVEGQQWLMQAWEKLLTEWRRMRFVVTAAVGVVEVVRVSCRKELDRMDL